MKLTRGTFASLANFNYRLFIVGQTVSMSGNWMQKVGQAWLILELTGSGTLVGLTAAMQHLPTTILGAWGGLQADRFDKRRVLLATQAMAGLLALLLGVLTAADVVEAWMVLAIALVLGLVEVIDRPARLAFVFEMVGPAQLTNAVTLNIIVLNVGRILGPAAAGVLIATVGIAFSFIANAITYVAVITVLLLLRTQDLMPSPPVAARGGLVREAAAYVRRTPQLLASLLVLSTATMLAYAWEVTLALLARNEFAGGARTFGVMVSAMGVGSVVGGLVVARHGVTTSRRLLSAAAAFSVLLAAVGLAPNVTTAVLLLVLLGVASIEFRSVAQAHVQMLATPEMRGRVTGLLGVASVGTKPIGSPLVGWVGDHVGARAAILLGAAATGLAAAAAWAYLRGRGGDLGGDRAVAPSTTEHGPAVPGGPRDSDIAPFP